MRMTEFELKFEISSASLQSVAIAMRVSKAKRQRLQARYFDTPDGLLAAQGIVVRLRKEGRRWVQTAKGPTAGLLERLEHNAVLPPHRAASLPTLDLSRHRATPVGTAIDKALGLNAGEAGEAGAAYPQLDLLYSTDIWRITRQLAIGDSMVEVALDQGRVFTDEQSQAVCELEIELKQGVPIDAIALARQWCAAHGLSISTIAKSMKGQRLRSNLAAADATSATLPQFSRHASSAGMLSVVVQTCLSQILPNMSELASGSNRAGHIHQLRVGIRRLRTALRELGHLASERDAIDPAWEPALVQVFRALGEQRDHSYLALVLQPKLLVAGGPHMRFNDAGSPGFDAGRAVRRADFQDALLGLLAFAYRLEPAGSDEGKGAGDGEDLKKAVSQRLAKLHRRALRDGKKFLTLSDVQQHSVRKRLKRLRYLMEFATPLFAAPKVQRAVAALKPVQDALGVYNDELMALQSLRAAVADDSQAWFGIGWLAARRNSNAKRCLKEIKAFADIKPFWRD